jgi:hypothetical protein
LGLASLALLATIAIAQETGTTKREHVVLNEEALVWKEAPPGLPAGAKMAVLAGDPGKEGIFTVRLQTPAGYQIRPHWHPTEEMLTIISGSVGVGAGERFDTSRGTVLRRGGFADLPAEHRHYAWTTEPSVIQITSPGPFVVHYVDPADDPRKPKE